MVVSYTCTHLRRVLWLQEVISGSIAVSGRLRPTKHDLARCEGLHARAARFMQQTCVVRAVCIGAAVLSRTPLPPHAFSAVRPLTDCSMCVYPAAAIDEWEGSVEKEFSVVVRQLPKADSKSKLECPVCLSSCPRQRDGWVVFPCNHGVCSRCFQHLIDTQVS